MNYMLVKRYDHEEILSIFSGSQQDCEYIVNMINNKEKYKICEIIESGDYILDLWYNLYLDADKNGDIAEQISCKNYDSHLINDAIKENRENNKPIPIYDITDDKMVIIKLN